MTKLIRLPGNIFLTESVVELIRNGPPAASDLPNPLSSIEYAVYPQRRNKGRWVLSWISKEYVPYNLVLKKGNIEVAFSTDAQSKLRGKIVDLIGGRICIWKKST